MFLVKLSKIISLLILLLPSFIFGIVQAQNVNGSNSIEQIKKVVLHHVEKNHFSGTILVAKEGKPIFHESYGLGYQKTPDTLENHYHFSIASVTKLFTAILVLQLVDTEKIDLYRPVVEYLPQFINQIPELVTPHHLLMHLSGLPNEKRKIYRHSLSPTEIASQTLSNASKATFNSFNYNNLDYVLLGLLIEKVSETSWKEAITEHILRPLQMDETGFLAYGDYPSSFGYTYSYKKPNNPVQDPLFYIENFYAAGSMYATSEDLLKLDQALYRNQLLTETGLELLSKSYPENNYAGYSVWNYQYPFVDSQPTIMERRGGILGANVVLVRLTDSNDTIIILSNNDQFNPDSFGDAGNLREGLIRALFVE